MSGETQEVQIQNLRQKKLEHMKNLKRLQNENGTRMEQLARIQEKIKTLTAEYDEREKEYKELHDELNDQMSRAKGTTNQHTTVVHNKHDDDIDDLKITEKFNSLLSELNKNIEANFSDEINYLMKQTSANNKNADNPENDAYAKSSFVAVGVKYVIEKIKPQGKGPEDDDDDDTLNAYYTTFRISSKTTFEELFEEACNFWGIGIDERKGYELVDESESQLQQENQNIEKYFKSKQGNYNQQLIYLRKSVNQKDSAHAQQEGNKVKGNAGDRKGDEIDSSKPKQAESDPYDHFFKLFPALKSYIDIDKVQVDQRKKIVAEKKAVKNKIDENHCSIVILITLILIFTVVPLQGERDIVSTYYTISSFQKAFGIKNDIFDVTQSSNTFQGIKIKADFYSFINYTIAQELFYLDPANPENDDADVLSNNFLISAVRMRQMKVASKPCNAVPNDDRASLACYYETYSEDHAQTDELFESESESSNYWQDDWGVYQTASQLKQKSKIHGSLATYDGSGYSVDIPWYSSQAEVQDFRDYLYNHTYIADDTKAIVITFNLYNQPGSFFIYNEFIIEVTSTGILLPSKASIVPFRTTFKHNANDRIPGRPRHDVYDALRTVCAVILSIFVIYKLFFREKFDSTYFFKLQGILNGAIILLCYLSVGFNNHLGSNSISKMQIDDILSSSTYLEMKQISSGYETSIIIMGILAGCTIARLFTILQMNARFFLIVASLERAVKQIIFYGVILAPLVIGFSIAGVNLFGPHVESFSTFAKAFISMLLFGLGQVDNSIFDQTSNSPVTIIYFTIYYFFVVFFLITVFAGIYIDSYRLIVMEYGYKFIEEDNWEISELIEWFVPKYFINKMKASAKKITDKFSMKKKIKNEKGARVAMKSGTPSQPKARI